MGLYGKSHSYDRPGSLGDEKKWFQVSSLKLVTPKMSSVKNPHFLSKMWCLLSLGLWSWVLDRPSWVLYSSRTITMSWHWIPRPAGRPSFRPWAAAHSQRHALRSHQTAANGHWSPPCGSWLRSHCMEISQPTNPEGKKQSTRWDGKMSF